MDTKQVTCQGCLKSYPISISLLGRVEKNEVPRKNYCTVTQKYEGFVLGNQQSTKEFCIYLNKVAEAVHQVILNNGAVRS